ncbi:MAG: ABC transporter permease [Actinomycetota bacterium]|nr:ABC transporter permease [Actinomycetota bacterium]
MLRFLVGRALWALVTLFLFVTISFFLINLLIPYDYATQFQLGCVECGQRVREQLGLDRPLWVRYLDYLGDLARGRLGYSFDGPPVTQTIFSALPTTLLIFGVGGILAYLLGDWLGRFVAWHRNRVVAGTTSTASVLFYTSFPPWLVFLLVYFGTALLLDARGALGLPVDSTPLWRESLASEADVIRVGGLGLFAALLVALVVRSRARRNGWRLVAFLALPTALAAVGTAMVLLGIGPQALDVLFFRATREVNIGVGSPVLATVALVLLAFGEVMFVLRTGIATEMREDYVATARAKGVPERLVRDRHVGRNAILPALSRFFTGVPYVITGLIIIERELAVQGLSSVFFAAVQEVDIPVILGTLVMIGMIGLALRLALDVLHAVLDPRIRYGEAR